MVRFDIECVLPFSPSLFWRIRDTPTFFKFVINDGLLKKLTATVPQLEDDGSLSRVQTYCPARVDCPEMIRSLIGDTMFEVSDHQRWNPTKRPNHLNFYIKPTFLSSVSKTFGELCVEQFEGGDAIVDENDVENESNDGSASTDMDPESSNASEGSDMESSPESIADYIDTLPANEKCRHCITGETRVSILTLGWFVERAIVHNLRSFYRDYPATIARFHKKLYAEFADGDYSVPVNKVVDRYMETQKPLMETEMKAAIEQREVQNETRRHQLLQTCSPDIDPLSDSSGELLDDFDSEDDLMMPS